VSASHSRNLFITLLSSIIDHRIILVLIGISNPENTVSLCYNVTFTLSFYVGHFFSLLKPHLYLFKSLSIILKKIFSKKGLVLQLTEFF